MIEYFIHRAEIDVHQWDSINYEKYILVGLIGLALHIPDLPRFLRVQELSAQHAT